MKKITKKLLSVVLATTMVATPITTFAFTGNSKFNTNTYTHQDRFYGANILDGIDVSSHNGDLNWYNVQAAGVDYAILRAACRGYGSGGTLFKDSEFEDNYAGAKSVGIPIGAYIYSQAITEAEAIAEADYILDVIGGCSLELPIVFDYEFADVSTGRLDIAWKNGVITKADMTRNAIAFCDRISQAGYKAMVYANKSFLNDNLDHVAIENAGYTIWLAHYTTNTNYTGAIDIWQYTSSGKLSTIPGKIFDCNFMYSNMINADSVSVAKPDVISQVEVTPVDSKYELTWTEVYGASGYKVQIKKNGKWTDCGESITNTLTVSGLGAGTIYPVRVCAYTVAGGKRLYGDYSAEAQIVTPMGAVTPKTSTATNSSITLTWTKQDATSGYEVYKYNSSTKKYELYKTITSPNTNTCKVSGLTANTKYKFKVRAFSMDVDEKTDGAFGSVLTQYTTVKKPTISTATAPSVKKIKATWKKVTGASGYQVMWSTTSDFSSNFKTKSVTAKYLTKTVTTAQSKKTYYVRVRAYRTINDKKLYSPWSKTLSVKTK